MRWSSSSTAVSISTPCRIASTPRPAASAAWPRRHRPTWRSSTFWPTQGRDLRALPFRERREALEELAASLGVFTAGDPDPGDLHPGDFGLLPWLLSPSTTDVDLALRWFHDFEPAGFDGVVAKALERPYAEGRREMIKLKHRRTVDCVVGGYRVHKDGRRVGSILLGLYDARGELHFIGHCSSFTQREAEDLLRTLSDLETAAGTASGG